MITTESACIDDLRETLKRALGDTGAERTMEFAIDSVSECIKTYCGVFEKGEVGPKGSARVAAPSRSKDIPTGTTGLLYGKVQSGKTNACIAVTAIALANGFRSFVVLTSDNVLLGTQTLERFREMLQFGPTVYGWEEWRADPSGFGEKLREEDRLADTGVVFVCTKNVKHLENLAVVLRKAHANEYPALLIDDEADHASLDTNIATRSRVGEADPSRIHELIGGIRAGVRHHIFLQVTATPQSLFLQGLDNPSRPRFQTLTHPGDSYVGGEVFFAADSKYCVAVDPDEFRSLEQKGKLQIGKYPEPPAGLRRALACFFLGCAQKYTEKTAGDRFSFLAHVSSARVNHRHLAGIIDTYVSKFDRALRGAAGENERQLALQELQRAHAEIRRTCTKLRPVAELADYLEKALRNVRAVTINAESSVGSITYQRGPNIFVGGNRLSRGVTIQGLMVTYYGRDAKAKLMDTVHQHARMFGYRGGTLDTTRLFSTQAILDTFKAIHDSDEAVRQIATRTTNPTELIPVWVGNGLKATRSNVIDLDELGVYAPTSAVYPWCPAYTADVVSKTTPRLDKLLAPYADDVYHDVDLGLIISLLENLPADDDNDPFWQQQSLIDAVANLSNPRLRISRGRILVKRGNKGLGNRVERPEESRADTAGGPWISTARTQFPNQPTLIVSMQRGEVDKNWDGHRFYAPTLVFPDGRFAFMYKYG